MIKISEFSILLVSGFKFSDVVQLFGNQDTE